MSLTSRVFILVLLNKYRYYDGIVFSGIPVGRNEVERITKIYRWLVNQQNSDGGFITSQTTVVAIQAMVKYAMWIENLVRSSSIGPIKVYIEMKKVF